VQLIVSSLKERIVIVFSEPIALFYWIITERAANLDCHKFYDEMFKRHGKSILRARDQISHQSYDIKCSLGFVRISL